MKLGTKQCPDCGSKEVMILEGKGEEPSYIKCKSCGNISILVEVKVDLAKDKSS